LDSTQLSERERDPSGVGNFLNPIQGVGTEGMQSSCSQHQRLEASANPRLIFLSQHVSRSMSTKIGNYYTIYCVHCAT